jgi:hypothetical protein
MEVALTAHNRLDVIFDLTISKLAYLADAPTYPDCESTIQVK